MEKEKIHKEIDIEKSHELFSEIKSWLHNNAKQVKMFEIDTFFTGEITCHERKDLGIKGYKQIKRIFKSFQELKEFYDKSQTKESIKKSIRSVRRNVKNRRGRPKKKMEKSKSKKTNGRRNNVSSRKTRRNV